MNSTNLTGRHSKDPELRYTNNGTAVCNFTLAVRNPFNTENNVDFIQCVAWGAAAELVAEKHVKGNMMGITGRIQTRNYESNDDGRTIYVTEVNASEIHLIDTVDREQNRDNYNNANNGNNGNNSNTNRNGKGSNNQQNKNQQNKNQQNKNQRNQRNNNN